MCILVSIGDSRYAISSQPMHFFPNLRRVLAQSKIDKIWIIYFTTYKMFANIKWSKPHKMLEKISGTHRNCAGRSRMTKCRVENSSKVITDNDLVFLADEFRRFLWFLVAIEPNLVVYFSVLSYSPIFFYFIYTILFYFLPLSK